MTISFIITTYNILPYLERCLQSVADVASIGDEVILVDDGSDDGTAARVLAFAEEGRFASGVAFRPICLGANTFGGVGIGANIGLTEARCDTVFFVDGDDWIDAVGFNRARAHWVLNPSEILIVNYLEFDEARQETRPPADYGKWSRLHVSAPLSDLRLHALSLIAVPWRKFYRRTFLEQHRLRFPEGDFFFEDNPFHWAVCMRAESIGFLDAVVCHHRVNRPGQTMASTGAELGAFFTHFDTILRDLKGAERPYLVTAARWLLANMTWHMRQLRPGAYHAYARAGGRALKLISDEIWEGDLAALESGSLIWATADRLRSGDIGGQIDAWHHQAQGQILAQIDARLQALEMQNQTLLQGMRGTSAADAFDAIAIVRRGIRPPLLG